MKGSARTAAVLGVGYTLGRGRKFRTAAVVAAAAAAGSTPVGGAVLRRGAKLLGSAGVLGNVLGKMPPEVADLVDTVRGDLVPAGKAAMSTAATSRVNALTDAIHERAELVRNPEAAAEPADEEDESAEDRDTEDRDTEDRDTEDRSEADEEPDEADEEPVTRVRRTSTRRRAPVTRAGR